MAVSAQDIVNSARKLLRAPFRLWQPGQLIPLWLNDGQGDPPPVAHLLSVGVSSTDLINFALRDNGLPVIGGTAAMPDNLLNRFEFDPNTPGELGAVAIKGYEGAGFGHQGHAILYIRVYRLLAIRVGRQLRIRMVRFPSRRRVSELGRQREPGLPYSQVYGQLP
jgi:hypothetical protein